MIKLLSTISDIILLSFTVFPCKVNSKHIKHNLKSSIINFVYELPHQFLNDLRLKILGNLENRRKSSNCVETQASVQFLLQRLIFGNNAQNLRKSRYLSDEFSGLVQFYLIFLLMTKYFVSDCRCSSGSYYCWYRVTRNTFQYLVEMRKCCKHCIKWRN